MFGPFSRISTIRSCGRFSARIRLLGARGLAILGLFLLLGTLPLEAHAQRDDQCQAEYARAQEMYLEAEFEPSIRVLRLCLDEAPLRDPIRSRFYRLLAFSYFGSGEREKAREAVVGLLRVNPDYEPDLESDRMDFVRMVEQVRREQEQMEEDKQRNWVKWVAAGVGVVALGVLAAVIGNSGGGDEDDD